jgi:pimeloyl-ACP methyl ester carboxylesterase
VSVPTRVPVLQVHGADDPCVLDRTMRACRARAAGEFTHRALPGVGPVPHQERPGQTSGLLGAFLSAW